MAIKWIGLFFIMFVFNACENKVDTKNMDRVELAYHENYLSLKKKLNKKAINIAAANIFIRAFKKEEIVEVWAKNKEDGFFKKIIKYSFCKNSGTLGPKRKEGDRQIPEGFYFINRFNPKSNFYLSLGLNYPNASDLILSDKESPGSDIFIHGGCQTVGCIPITDEKIMELYVLVNEAKKNGQMKIPVHIYPFKMTDSKMGKCAELFPQHKMFWKNLQRGYSYFEKNKKPAPFSVKSNGHYFYKE